MITALATYTVLWNNAEATASKCHLLIILCWLLHLLWVTVIERLTVASPSRRPSQSSHDKLLSTLDECRQKSKDKAESALKVQGRWHWWYIVAKQCRENNAVNTLLGCTDVNPSTEPVSSTLLAVTVSCHERWPLCEDYTALPVQQLRLRGPERHYFWRYWYIIIQK